MKRRWVLSAFGMTVALSTLLGACGNESPGSVSAVIEPAAGADGQGAQILLSADVGGGCNVDRIYNLDLTSTVRGATQVVTIDGSNYNSDGEECTDLATAEARLALDPGFGSGELTTLRFELDETESIYGISYDQGRLTIDQVSIGSVTLRCGQSWEASTCSTLPE